MLLQIGESCYTLTEYLLPGLHAGYYGEIAKKVNE